MKLKKRNIESIIIIPNTDGSVGVWYQTPHQGHHIGDTGLWPTLHEIIKIATSEEQS